MRRSGSAAVLVALVALGSLVAGLFSPLTPPAGGVGAPSSARASQSVRVVDQNVEDGARAVREALRRAAATDAQFVMLQEVCATDVARIRRQHPAWSVNFRADHNRGCEGLGGSVAIARQHRGLRSVSHTFAAQASAGGVRSRSGVACVVGPEVAACSVHIFALDRPTGRRQIVELAAWLRQHAWAARGRVVVVGGDFNRTPKHADLDPIFAYGGGRGDFVEVSRNAQGQACRCGPATHGTTQCRLRPSARPHRIDYVFVARPRFSVSSPAVSKVYGCAGSDHKLVYARAQLN